MGIALSSKIEFGFCLRISQISYRGYSIDLLASEIARALGTLQLQIETRKVRFRGLRFSKYAEFI